MSRSAGIAALTIFLAAGISNVAHAQSIAAGAALWTGQGCSGCHGLPPDTRRDNAANASVVIDAAIANNSGGFMGTFSGLTATERQSLALYIGSTIAGTQSTSVVYHGSVGISLIDIATTSAVPASTLINAVSTVGAPVGGTLGAYGLVTPSVTYTHTANNCSNGSFVFHGTGILGAVTSNRSVTITITPPAAPTAAGSTSNIAYNSGSSTNIPLTIGGGPNTGVTVTSGLSPNVGTLSVVGSTISYTASTTTYAPSMTFQYRADGPCANSGSVTVTINVAAPGPSQITSTNSTAGIAGLPFSFPVTANNVPTSFAATGLPAGLSINPGTGLISGTSTVSGMFTAMITATGPGGAGATQALTINLVLNAPQITSANSTPGQSGVAFSFQVTADRLPTGFAATGLPPGLAINPATGLISGTPVVAMGGPVVVMVTASNAAGPGPTQAFTINMTLNPPTFTSANTAGATSGQAFSFPVTATDFPTSFGAAGLPAGLSINPVSGLISGTVTVALTTTYMVTLTATNGAGFTNQTLALTVTLLPPAITSPAMASGTATFAFSYQIAASNGPTSFGASGLPAGFTVNTVTGVISGVPATTGTFSIMVTATNAAGTATQAVTISIFNQPTPRAVPFTFAVPFNMPATYDLTASITGSYTSVNITSQVTHGTLVVNGLIVTYTPFSGYFGPDSFAFTATGPGGISPAATATITVGNPAAPTASAKNVSIVFNTATTIDLTSSITGVATGVTVTTAPTHGTTSINGLIITYTPVTGYYGDDKLSYSAVGPGGTSMPVDITIKVTPLAPSADTVTFILPLNTPTTLDLAPFIKGTLISGVALVGLPQHGSVTVSGTKVTYTPKTDFFGPDTFTYSAYGVAGSSPAATVKVTVVGRPDPTKNANVSGLIQAQMDSAQRFSRAQIANFQGRMETLHRSGESGLAPPPGSIAPPAKAAPVPATTPEPAKTSDGRTINPDNASRSSAFLPTSYAGPVPAGTPLPFASDIASLVTTRSLNVASLVSASTGGGGGGGADSSGSRGGLNFWISGVANFGKRVATVNRNQLDFTTDGVSLGVDRRFSDKLAAGVGAGFARDHTDIGSDGSKSRARSASVAAYATYHPSQNTFVDGLIGAGSLSFTNQRYVLPIDSIASDDRSGSQLFASIASGYEYRNKGFLLSPYARLDYTSDRLNQSTESGAGQYALTYFKQTTPSLQGVLGLRAEALSQTNYGWAAPRARIEYRREFQGDRDVSLAYADLVGGPSYSITTGALSRNTLVAGIGADFIRRGGLTIGLDYQLQHNFSKDSAQGFRLNFSQDLDALGSPSALRGFFSIPQKPEKIQLDAGFMFDDNVTRAKADSDKRSDRAYSVNAGKGFVFTFETDDNPRENLRALVNVTLGGEKFQIYDGLSRAIAGVDGELQYRTSADFDAVTFAVFARTSAERYRSQLRNGYRYSAGVSVRQSLTDRIDIFAALAHNERVGKSSVFNNRDNSFRLNLDYTLSDREVLYATGEYRRGQNVSTGLPSLENIEIAEVFIQDDAYPGGQLFSYRFVGRTVISTLGYNIGFGPRHSLDVSWRRAQSTPNFKPSFPSSTSGYIADQYSVVYLVRF